MRHYIIITLSSSIFETCFLLLLFFSLLLNCSLFTVSPNGSFHMVCTAIYPWHHSRRLFRPITMQCSDTGALLWTAWRTRMPQLNGNIHRTYGILGYFFYLSVYPSIQFVICTCPLYENKLCFLLSTNIRGVCFLNDLEFFLSSHSRRALDLSLALITAANIRTMMKELLAFLSTCPLELRSNTASGIFNTAERYRYITKHSPCTCATDCHAPGSLWISLTVHRA